MAGGSVNSLQQGVSDALAEDTKTSSDALTAAQMQEMANQKLADSQRAAYLLSSTPVQQYYNPAAQQPTITQSPTLRVPGFQGVRNPFVSQAAATQPVARTQQGAIQIANLLNQTNAYNQNYASQLYTAQQANQAQLAAMQKAYQDKQAADRAAAEAAAKRERRQNMFGPFGGIFGGGGEYAEGGIAGLMKGRE